MKKIRYFVGALKLLRLLLCRNNRIKFQIDDMATQSQLATD